MRVAVHDYTGHPFQVELSRELARRGHDVLHLYSSAITSPRGALEHTSQDPARLEIEPVALETKIDRDRFVARRGLEAEHGRRVVRCLQEFAPEVVLSANAPLESQNRISAYCKQGGIGFVFWVQDLIGEATARLLRKRMALAAPVAWHYRRLERRLLWSADAVVAISEDFRPHVPPWAKVIENWAPLGDLPLLPKNNGWSVSHGLDTSVNLLYSGTLGMKHDPGLLVRLADICHSVGDARVVVASEGRAAEWLSEQGSARTAQNLTVLPFQPFEHLAEMHASADILVTILEPDAGVFSVPSKVLSYLCAGRPLLLVMPPENLAARIVREIGAGFVVEPGDVDGLELAVAALLDHPEQRQAMGERARAYAERTFDINAISDRFERVLEDARRASGHGASMISTSAG